MNYQNTLTYLYESAPMFQQIGGKAYKEGLENTKALDEHFDYPHKRYRTIHVGGTNGKGSCSHTLASILQSAGYRVGLYTSPHLIDFRERIRINGEMITENYVVEFVEKHRSFFEPLYPSFFELTTAMALRYFADEQVEIAIIEVGMGGRLDCTNIIHPDLCIITNISLDHTQFLGNTLKKIAFEKAGIIKEGIPVVIGETTQETQSVFTQKAAEMHAPIVFAEQEAQVKQYETSLSNKEILYETNDFGFISGELRGSYQVKNTNTILSAIPLLRKAGYRIEQADIEKGFCQVCKLTGLMGRWQMLQGERTIICDTGHNFGGISYVIRQLHDWTSTSTGRIHFVFGMVNDKDIRAVLELLPQKEFNYYFTKASVQRALPEQELQRMALAVGLEGGAYPTVVEAIEAAKKESLPEDLIFVGGSSFIVADLLANRDTLNLY